MIEYSDILKMCFRNTIPPKNIRWQLYFIKTQSGHASRSNKYKGENLKDLKHWKGTFFFSNDKFFKGTWKKEDSGNRLWTPSKLDNYHIGANIAWEISSGILIISRSSLTSEISIYSYEEPIPSKASTRSTIVLRLSTAGLDCSETTYEWIQTRCRLKSYRWLSWICHTGLFFLSIRSIWSSEIYARQRWQLRRRS